MNVLKSKVAGAAAAVVLAGAGAALLVGYVKGAEDRALKGEEPATVYVVADTIAKGTKGEELGAKVRQETVPVKVRAAGAVPALDALAGKVALVDLVPGEQLVTTRFGSAADAAGIPSNLLQVTVAMDAVRALGGQVREGDSVGVLASFKGDTETTHMILQKVRVTGVRNESGSPVRSRPDAAVTGRLMVTLALDAPSVERVVFAAEHGSLWLTAEPAEASEAGTKVQTRGTVNL